MAAAAHGDTAVIARRKEAVGLGVGSARHQVRGSNLGTGEAEMGKFGWLLGKVRLRRGGLPHALFDL